jgi:hypothetical protein
MGHDNCILGTYLEEKENTVKKIHHWKDSQQIRSLNSSFDGK